MNRRLPRLLLPMLALALLAASCRHFLEASYIPYVERNPYGPSNLIEVSYALADEIHRQVNATVPHHEPLAVAGFAQVDDQARTTPLGLMLGKQVASRLAQHGYAVLDITPKVNCPTPEGPPENFLPIWDMGGLDPSLDFSRIVVGVYGQTQDGLYVNARMVDRENGLVLGAADSRLDILEDDPLLE